MLALALAGGCGSSHPSATTASEPSSSSTSSTTPSSTTTTTTGSTLARCQPAQLTGSVEGTSGAAGTEELTLALRNVGPASCQLEGYPGAQLIDANGNALPTAVVRGGSDSFTDMAPSSVVLAAGDTAYVNFAYSDVPTGTTPCESAAALWLTPPDDVTHLVLDVSLTACDGGALTTSPVLGAGSPGSQTTAPSSK